MKQTAVSKMVLTSSIFDMDFVLIVRIICFLPFVSSMCCVLTSILLHFEEVTKTHCEVPNFLPSISAATGDYPPEKYIWRIGIGYHSFIRIVTVIIEHNMLHNRCLSAIGTSSVWFIWMTRIKSLLLITENFALVLLTYVSSDENYSFHEKSFILFMVAAMLHMLLSCILRYQTSKSPMSYEETVSLRRKVMLLFVNCGSFATSVYLFFRHNWYCEPGVYSLFAFFEYVVVFSNILFHYTIVDDIKGAKFFVGYTNPPPTIKQN